MDDRAPPRPPPVRRQPGVLDDPLANAYGLSPTFDPPVYAGQAIPHLNFAIDKPDPRPRFSPFSAEIGPLDLERVNAMCLIEFPGWDQGAKPDLREDVVDYGSIGAFYDAVEYGASLLKWELKGGVRQVDHFGAFYRYLPALTVADSGEAAFREAALLIAVIRDQGEGTAPNGIIRPVFQNTADDGTAGKDHYAKFIGIREAPLPTTYPVKSPGTYIEHDEALLKVLVASFDELRAAMTAMFAGGNPNDFLPVMIKVGAGTQTCWKNGLVPRFS